MKIKLQQALFAMLLLGGMDHAAAQAIDDNLTAMVYQAQLLDHGSNLLSATYDMTFTLYQAGAGGSPIAGPITNLGVALKSGLINTRINFGSAVFNASTNWLEIGVRSNGSGAFTILAPRQHMASTSRSIYALNAGTAAIATTALLNATAPGVSPPGRSA